MNIPAMHFSVVVSHETGAQQACVAEQSAPSTLGPAVHWALSAEETEVGPLEGIEAMDGEEEVKMSAAEEVHGQTVMVDSTVTVLVAEAAMASRETGRRRLVAEKSIVKDEVV